VRIVAVDKVAREITGAEVRNLPELRERCRPPGHGSDMSQVYTLPPPESPWVKLAGQWHIHHGTGVMICWIANPGAGTRLDMTSFCDLVLLGHALVDCPPEDEPKCEQCCVIEAARIAWDY